MQVADRVKQLIHDISQHGELADLPQDGEPNCDLYNDELYKLRQSSQSSWGTGPWLYCECYMYRLLRSFFSSTATLKQFDPFAEVRCFYFPTLLGPLNQNYSKNDLHSNPLTQP